MTVRKTVKEMLRTPYATRVVVTVDDADAETGTASLIDAHRDPGIRHRAFSLVLYRIRNGKKEILLQQRSEEKPVFPLFWTNTCCYNMAPGEDYLERAAVRVHEEMGVDIRPSDLSILYKFSYYAADIKGWCENETDSVIVGFYDGPVAINPHEAADYRWMEWNDMKKDIKKNPDTYAPWWKMIAAYGRLEKYLEPIS